MSAIDSAISRIQVHIAACTDVVFKSYPDYPTENANPFPMSLAYIRGGSLYFANKSMLKNFPVLRVELHFSRVNLKQSHQQMDAIAVELPKRLAGDPTLNDTVASIVATQDQPITYEAVDFEYGSIKSRMLYFDIPVKLLDAPQ